MTVYELKIKLGNFNDNDTVVLDIPTRGLYRIGSVVRGVNEQDGLVFISPTPTCKCPSCGQDVDMNYLGTDDDEYECECRDCKLSFAIKEQEWRG